MNQIEVMSIPYQVSESEFDIIVGVPEDSLGRIRQYDPMEIPVRRIKFYGPYEHLKLRSIHVTYCTAEDIREVQRLSTEHHDLAGILKHMTRGWKYRPEMGDNDLPPMNMKPVN